VEGVRGAGLCAVQARRRGDEQARAACGEGGAFELTALLPGTYDLVVTTFDGRTGGLPLVTLAEGQERRGLRLSLAGDLTLVGRLVDLESRRPLAGARLEVSDGQTTVEAVSDTGGRFRVERVPRGEISSGCPPRAVERLSTPRVWVTRQRWSPWPMCCPFQRPKLIMSAAWAPTRLLKTWKSLTLPVSVTPWKIL